MVTKDMLEWTRDQRADLKAEMHLRPGGATEAEVNEIERTSLETSIRLQEDILRRALATMREQRAMSFNGGLVKAHFNKRQEIKP
jgi:hypothetical protein